ncbi:hypothetical protein B0H13DRAFT_1614139 [Mycena leptocephala]|nr:hypothetical protein B0H13DRAFT_1614139 [Mycena leptocephala]
MAGNPNTLVVLGSSPDSYFLGHGRRYFVENMPASFTNHVQTQLNISMTLWISMNKSLDSWITHNAATANFHFNRSMNDHIQDHLSAANGKFAADFVAFPDSDDPNHYFVKGKDSCRWTATLPGPLLQELKNETAEVPNFDAAITGMLFGKGKSYICLFSGGFLANLDDDEVQSVEHPLYKVLSQYSEGWCIERGSTLCFYDSQFFFLKFKRPGQSQIKLHWNLPEAAGTKLRELMELMKQPEEQLGLQTRITPENDSQFGSI